MKTYIFYLTFIITLTFCVTVSAFQNEKVSSESVGNKLNLIRYYMSHREFSRESAEAFQKRAGDKYIQALEVISVRDLIPFLKESYVLVKYHGFDMSALFGTLDEFILNCSLNSELEADEVHPLLSDIRKGNENREESGIPWLVIPKEEEEGRKLYLEYNYNSAITKFTAALTAWEGIKPPDDATADEWKAFSIKKHNHTAILHEIIAECYSCLDLPAKSASSWNAAIKAHTVAPQSPMEKILNA